MIANPGGKVVGCATWLRSCPSTDHYPEPEEETRPPGGEARSIAKLTLPSREVILSSRSRSRSESEVTSDAFRQPVSLIRVGTRFSAARTDPVFFFLCAQSGSQNATTGCQQDDLQPRQRPPWAMHRQFRPQDVWYNVVKPKASGLAP